MAAKSLTEELHDLIFNENYATTIELTDSSECINSSELYHLRKYVTKTCNLQTSSLIDKKGQAIPSGIFQLFVKFSGKTAGCIRDKLLSWCSEWEEEICNLVKHYFNRDEHNFNGWYVKTSNTNNSADKLSLFLLCKQYSRHLILINRTDYWSTLNPAVGLTESDVCDQCDIRLLHLGTRKFALIECKSGYSISNTIELI